MTPANPQKTDLPMSDSPPPAFDDRTPQAQAVMNPFVQVLLARVLARSPWWIYVGAGGTIGSLLVTGVVMFLSSMILGSAIVNLLIACIGAIIVGSAAYIFYRAWRDRALSIDHAVEHNQTPAAPNPGMTQIPAKLDSLAQSIRIWIAATSRPTESRIQSASSLLERLFILDKGPTIAELSTVIANPGLFHDTLDWLASIDAVGFSSDRSRVWLNGDFKRSLVEAGLNARDLRKKGGIDD